jgi:hypothetical protein
MKGRYGGEEPLPFIHLRNHLGPASDFSTIEREGLSHEEAAGMSFAIRFSRFFLWIVPVILISSASPAAGGEDEDWVLPTGCGKYADQLRDANLKSAKVSGLSLEASLIPNAYLFFMARGLDELDKAGYTGGRLVSELKSLHKKYRKYHKKPLILVKAHKDKDRDNMHFFLKVPIRRLLHLEQERQKTFTILPLKKSKKPKYEKWQVFENRANVPRKIFRENLHRLEMLDLSLISSTVKMDEKDPIRLSFQGLIAVAHTGGVQSVNPQTRQISTQGWREHFLSPKVLTFYPGRLKQIRPPRGYYDLLKRIDKEM